jgi:predicted kinase
MNAQTILWLCGQPGVGKTRLARGVVDALREKGVPVVLLDEAEQRAGLGNDLGSTETDQAELERRIAALAVSLADQGVTVVAACCSARDNLRRSVRRVLSVMSYQWVQVECDASLLGQRLPKPSLLQQLLAESWEPVQEANVLKNDQDAKTAVAALLELLATGKLLPVARAKKGEEKPGFRQNWKQREREQREELLQLPPAELDRMQARPRNPAERMYGRDAVKLPWYYSIVLAGWSPAGLATLGVAIVSMIGVTIYATRAAMKEIKLEQQAAVAALPKPQTEDPTKSVAATKQAQMLLQDLVKSPDPKALQEKGFATAPVGNNLDQRELVLQEARGVLEKYQSAKAWEQKRDWVYDPKRVGPLMQSFYTKDQGVEPPTQKIAVAAEVTDGANRIVECVLPIGQDGRSGLFWMRRGADGELKLDWESYVGAGEMSWTAFKESRATQRTILRAWAEVAEYYNYEFADRERYVCLKLTSADEKQQLYAYAERNSGAAMSTSLLLASGRGQITLRVSFPEKAQSSECVILNDIVKPSWLLTE